MSVYIGYLTNTYYGSLGQSSSYWNCSNLDMALSDVTDTRINFFYEYNIMLREQWDYLEINAGSSLEIKLGSTLLAVIAGLISNHFYN